MKDTYSILQQVVSLFMKYSFNPKITFEEEIPEDEKILLVGNHTSNFDCLLLATAVYRKINFLAKSELFKGPLKKLMEEIDSIPVNRDGSDMKALTTAINFLKDDNCVLIFPEGTRSESYKTDKLILPFKVGTVMIAKRSHANIMPFSITGNYKLIKNNLHLSFGKIIKTDDYSSKELLEKVEDDVKKLILKNR